MPTGPKGEKRPADVIGNAVKIARIATGEDPETIPDDGKNKAAQELGRQGGKKRAAIIADIKAAESSIQTFSNAPPKDRRAFAIWVLFR